MNDIHFKLNMATCGIAALVFVYNILMSTKAQIRIDAIKPLLMSNKDDRRRVCDTTSRDIQTLNSIRFNHVLNAFFLLLVAILQLINVSLI